uniref:DUF663 domain-containing protein n=1 Tax=Mesocestoides corti TaxID=53468 RepID=A0A5K3FZD9_MESCO
MYPDGFVGTFGVAHVAECEDVCFRFSQGVNVAVFYPSKTSATKGFCNCYEKTPTPFSVKLAVDAHPGVVLKAYCMLRKFALPK